MACVFPRPAKDSLELIYPGVAANPCCGDSPSPPQRWGSERDLAKRKSTLLERLTRWAKKGMGEADWELGTVGTQLAGEDTFISVTSQCWQRNATGSQTHITVWPGGCYYIELVFKWNQVRITERGNTHRRGPSPHKWYSCLSSFLEG